MLKQSGPETAVSGPLRSFESYSPLFLAVVSAFAFVDFFALRLALAVFVEAAFELLDLAAADFADFLVVSCFVWPAC